jgi:hypothetical protein
VDIDEILQDTRPSVQQRAAHWLRYEREPELAETSLTSAVREKEAGLGPEKPTGYLARIGRDTCYAALRS